LPIDDTCNDSRVIIGNEYISFIKIRVEQRWFSRVPDPRVSGHFIYNSATGFQEAKVRLNGSVIRWSVVKNRVGRWDPRKTSVNETVAICGKIRP
jgi:hypothetical protein